ncbi:MAG: adenosylcobalamin-dependent ribonucleoside-diphosphate reductase, partial [Candidatus Azambacteria bacterium]|nr:adenosylcobalamin-dependent ribonucleoside-diphosphate reductase [Candidatus Azambacteria bacterium]
MEKEKSVYIALMPKDLIPCVWTEDAIRLVNERFLRRDQEGKTLETTEGMCWRIAYHIASADQKYGKTEEETIELAKEFYDLMANRKFFPNAPTMYNAGTGNGLQFSACFVLPIEDSMEGIYDAVKWQALIHKSGGGTGFPFSFLRPKNALVGSTRGKSSGPISFLGVFDASTDKVIQGGTRRGANMAVFSIHHPDILEVITCKNVLDDKNKLIYERIKPHIYSRKALENLRISLLGTQISHFNISIAITDVFMKAVKENAEYDLLDPRDNKLVNRLNARTVFNLIVKTAWEIGDPGLWFIDKTNRWRANPLPDLMKIEATNPCGEQPLFPFDVCNLGSVALVRFISKENGEYVINWGDLEKAIRLAVHFLDNVIDLNPYPLPQIMDLAHKIRRIGLGVMGWADMLAYLNIPYVSNEACELADRVSGFINKIGHKKSEELAEERGPFPLWDKSIYKDGKPIRNCTITTIAPTGELRILAGCSGGIEPHFGLTEKHHFENRTLFRIQPAFTRFIEIAKERGFHSFSLEEEVKNHGKIGDLNNVPDDVKKIFITAHEIPPEWHVKMQAAFQRNTDNGVSKTINLVNSATLADVEKAFLLAYETECLGITVFRDGSKGAVLSVGIGGEKAMDFSPSSISKGYIRPRPKTLGTTECIKTPDGNAFITINWDRELGPSELFEVFINVGKAGTDILADAEAIGRAMSFTLRAKAQMPLIDRLKEFMDQYSGIGGSRTSGFGQNKVASLADGISKAIKIFLEDFGFTEDNIILKEPDKEATVDNIILEKSDKKAIVIRGNYCPECHKGTLINEEGCT